MIKVLPPQIQTQLPGILDPVPNISTQLDEQTHCCNCWAQTGWAPSCKGQCVWLTVPGRQPLHAINMAANSIRRCQAGYNTMPQGLQRDMYKRMGCAPSQFSWRAYLSPTTTFRPTNDRLGYSEEASHQLSIRWTMSYQEWRASSHTSTTSWVDSILAHFHDTGLAIKRKKCLFGVSELKLLGYNFSPEGMQPVCQKTEVYCLIAW